MKTTSLELSKQLYELGVRVESEFWWVYADHIKDSFIVVSKYDKLEAEADRDVNKPIIWMANHRYNKDKAVPAPTSDELAEVIPSGVTQDGKYLHIYYLKDLYSTPRRTVWRAYLSPINELHHMRCFYQEADTLTDAMAKMLIYLKTNNLLSLHHQSLLASKEGGGVV